MVVKEAKVPKWVSLWGMPEDVLSRIGEQIDYFQNATNRLGEQVRDIAQETIDLLLSSPIPNDIDEQKRDIVERYSAILVQFASTTADPHSTLNQMWTDMEQSVSFYLLDAGHNDDADPTEACPRCGLIRGCWGMHVPTLRRPVSNHEAVQAGYAECHC